MSSTTQSLSPINQVPRFDWRSLDPKNLIQAINIVGNVLTLYSRDLASCSTGTFSLDADTAQVGERVVLDHALQWYVSKCSKAYSWITSDMPLHQTMEDILHPLAPDYHLHIAYEGGITTQDLQCILEGFIKVQKQLTPEKRKALIENRWLNPQSLSFLKSCKKEGFDQFIKESSTQPLIPEHAKNDLIKRYQAFCEKNPNSLYYFEKAKEYIEQRNTAYLEAMTKEMLKFGCSFGTGTVSNFVTVLLRETTTLSEKKINALHMLPLAIWAGYNLLSEGTFEPWLMVGLLNLLSEKINRYWSVALFSILLALSMIPTEKENISDPTIPLVTVPPVASFLISAAGYYLGSVTGETAAKIVAPSVSFWAKRTENAIMPTVTDCTQTVSAWINYSRLPFLAQRAREIVSDSGAAAYNGCIQYLNAISS